MAKTTTNQTDLSYVVETVAGETPATPAFQLLPTTGGALAIKIKTEVSEVIRSDRQIDDLIPVDGDVAGDINYELSYAPYKPLMEQLLRGTSATVDINPITGVSFDVSASTIGSSGSTFLAEHIVPGMFIRVAGATNAGNNRVYKVEQATETLLTVSPAPAVDETAPATASIVGYMIRNGVENPVTNTFMKRITTSIDTFNFYYAGTVVSQMSLSLPVNGRITGTLSLMGRTEITSDADLSGQTVIPVPAHTIMNSVSNVQEIILEGSTATTCFQKLDLTINNNSTGAKCIGIFGSSDIQDFALDVTGSIEMYFEDLAMYNSFKNASSFSLSVSLRDASGNGIVISMPYVKFEDLSIPIAGKNQFLTMPGTIRAMRDPTLGYTIQFDFFSAA